MSNYKGTGIITSIKADENSIRIQIKCEETHKFPCGTEYNCFYSEKESKSPVHLLPVSTDYNVSKNTNFMTELILSAALNGSKLIFEINDSDTDKEILSVEFKKNAG